MFSYFDILSVLVVLTAILAWLNHVGPRLPNAIGLLVMGLGASVLIVFVEIVFPGERLFHSFNMLLLKLDFAGTVLDGMLAFLLFAGALQVDLSRLRERKWTIAALATLGVMISIVVFGCLIWALAGWIGPPMPLLWAFLLGAIISPTDPVAVLGALNGVELDTSLEMDIVGESLFNDGIGIVAFTLLVTAVAQPTSSLGVATVATSFLEEAGGGAILGLAAGFCAYQALKSIDEYPVEVLISLALVGGTYSAATHLGVSGPIAVVVSGVLIGNKGSEFAMSETTRTYLFGFWRLIDEMLNSFLFLIIGLQVIVLSFDASLIPFALLTIPVALVARLFAVGIPVAALSALGQEFQRGTVPVMTWAGVRGGISIALALSIPASPEKQLVLNATYAVAIVTIVLQGLTLRWVANRTGSLKRIEQ